MKKAWHTLSSMILSELNPFTCFSGTQHSTKLFALLRSVAAAAAADVGLHMPLSHSLEYALSFSNSVCVCVCDPQPLITFCSIASDAIAAIDAAFGDWRMRLKNFVQL